MKLRMRLAQLSGMLPEQVQQALAEMEQEAAVLRKAASTPRYQVQPGDILPGERAAIRYVSTRDIDRDSEILDPDGADLSTFKLAPQVLWGHNYAEPPIGSDAWIRSDGYGLVAKTLYAETPRASEVWSLVQGGHLSTSSVGFMPLESVDNGGPGWASEVRRLGRKWEMDEAAFALVSRIYTKWTLLEHSDVSVPANPYALTQAVAKGLTLSPDMLKELGIEPDAEPMNPAPDLKGVIPYRDLGNADEGATWDGPAEIAAAEVDDLRLMCAWFDGENAEVKSAYKLPHHRASGGHPAIWRGVAAAMGVLMGAMGGVDIPEADRAGVYRHLARHYADFDKEPPEMRSTPERSVRHVIEVSRSVVPARSVREVTDITRMVREVIETACGRL